MMTNPQLTDAVTHLAAAVTALARQRLTDDATRTTVLAHVEAAMRENDNNSTSK